MSSSIWVPVLESGQLRSKPQRIDLFFQVWVVFRDSKGQAHALFDLCPHRHVALSKGKVRGDLIECSYHGLRFDGEGFCKHVPVHDENDRLPTTRVERFPVLEKAGWIWVALESSLNKSDGSFGVLQDRFNIKVVRLSYQPSVVLEKLKMLSSKKLLELDKENHGYYGQGEEKSEFWVMIFNGTTHLVVYQQAVEDSLRGFLKKLKFSGNVRKLQNLIKQSMQA